MTGLLSPVEPHQLQQLEIWPSISAAHYPCTASYADKSVCSHVVWLIRKVCYGRYLTVWHSKYIQCILFKYSCAFLRGHYRKQCWQFLESWVPFVSLIWSWHAITWALFSDWFTSLSFLPVLDRMTFSQSCHHLLNHKTCRLESFCTRGSNKFLHSLGCCLT